jgi:two-component system sensor histidine kinase MprB
MDAFTVEHAFDRFFRGNGRGEIPGSGLGLAIVRRIAERAGGSVALRSAPGAGTVVEMRVPRATPS